MAGPLAVGVDTDALVNLLALGCFDDALTCLGCRRERCYRLPVAEAQVRRGSWLEKQWPNADRAALGAIVKGLPHLLPPASMAVQEALNRIDTIDGGEAYLLAAAHEAPDLLVISGDGRMLRALHRASDIVAIQVRESLAGRVLFFPQLMAGLVQALSLVEIEARWRASPSLHKSLRIMFGTTSPTREDDFWQGFELEMDGVLTACGKDWLSRHLPIGRP